MNGPVNGPMNRNETNHQITFNACITYTYNTYTTKYNHTHTMVRACEGRGDTGQQGAARIAAGDKGGGGFSGSMSLDASVSVGYNNNNGPDDPNDPYAMAEAETAGGIGGGGDGGADDGGAAAALHLPHVLLAGVVHSSTPRQSNSLNYVVVGINNPPFTATTTNRLTVQTACS